MAVFEKIKGGVMDQNMEISEVGVTISSFKDTVLRNGRVNFVCEDEATAESCAVC